MLTFLAVGATAAADPPKVPDFGSRLERFTYPYPVLTFPVSVVGKPAEMAFMDVAADRPNGRTAVLLHARSFCGASWESTVRALSGAGYRVIVPDQLGFCKSSKPRDAQYSFAMMADATRRLLVARGVTKPIMIGHGMGGMLAVHYALLFPDAVDRLVLVSPLGLRDRAEEGLPYNDVDTLWARERRTSFTTIKAYQQENYYHGAWKPPFERWAWVFASMYQGKDRDLVALAQAKVNEMIYTQPVARELGRIKARTTLIVGTMDKSAFGRDRAPASLQRFLEAIPMVAPAATRAIPNATLVKLEGVGHAPQIEVPERFEKALLAALGAPARR